MRLGLIINPVAGIGGRVGLKGSDGADIQQLALRRGAQPQSSLRATDALDVLKLWKEKFELVTPPGVMGEETARQCGFSPQVIGELTQGATSPADTQRLAKSMVEIPVDLLLFAGGDGTARDIYDAVGENLPVLGIPAGVKIHSAVFANNPRAAGEIASAYLSGERTDARIRMRESEVIDLDEELYRNGILSTRLYGYLKVPFRPHLVQNRKVPSPAAESARLEAIAADVVGSMQPDCLYVIGPGTTTRAIADQLGFPKTLVGVDVYSRDQVVALDAGEAQLLELLEDQSARIIVTPIGGQGFIFGRGNQPISPRVIQVVGHDNILVVSLVEKLNALRGEPLLVDTGDSRVDEILSGYMPVVVGYHDRVMYRVTS